MNDSLRAAGLGLAQGGHWPPSPSWPQGGKVWPWPLGLPVSKKMPFCLDLPHFWKGGVLQELLHREYQTDETLSEQRLPPRSEPPSPAAAWAICRSTCQEQNANPHRRRRARASEPSRCVYNPDVFSAEA